MRSVIADRYEPVRAQRAARIQAEEAADRETAEAKRKKSRVLFDVGGRRGRQRRDARRLHSGA
ncbi:hypothetical protein [Streptomyces sp. NPDC091027]|uniref:hypothetical protein n=1 Tax=Streptomyces sp. NPDC091027 TaxID=3365971 RepID=UPI0037F2568A